MNQSILETKLFFWDGIQGLSGLRSLLKGESALFDREKYLQNSGVVAIFCIHPTCFMLLPSPALWLTSFAGWCGVSTSWLLILQGSDNSSSFICHRLVFLAGSPHLWDSPALPMSVQLSILPFSSGTDRVFGGHIQTQHPTPQTWGFTGPRRYIQGQGLKEDKHFTNTV